MANELKPCPFCGFKPRLYIKYSDQAKAPFSAPPVVGYVIRCSKCNGKMTGSRKSSIVKAWNRRANDGQVHAHWRLTEGNWFECAGKDGCGCYTDEEHCGNYCPECGAKMDEEIKDDGTQ